MTEKKKTIEQTRKPRKLKPTDTVLVMNYTTGELIYEPRGGQGRSFSLMEFGDTEELELSELRTMKNSQPKFLTEPWLFIVDEDAVDYLGLKSLYEDVIKPDDLDGIFKLGEVKLQEILEKSPESVKILIGLRAKQLIANKKLSDINVIRTIENALHTELLQ